MRQLRFVFIALALMLVCVACDDELAAKSEDGSGEAAGRHLALAPLAAAGLLGSYYPPYAPSVPYGPPFGYRHLPYGYGGAFPYPPYPHYNPYAGYFGGIYG